MKAAPANLGRVLSILALLASTGTAQTSPTATFQWPDSSRYSRVIVNAQEGMEGYPKEWFSQDTLVTDLTIADTRNKSPEAAMQQYQALRELLTSYGLAVGTYISGTTAEPEAMETKWPWAVVPLEWMTPDSLYVGVLPDEPYRKIINVSDPATRRAFQANIRKLWEETPAPVRFIDNAAIHPSAGKGQPWASYCQNMKEIRELGEAMGSVQIFNVSVHVGELSDAEANQLIEAVGHGGILLEMPWHQNIRSNAAATERARFRYRQLLDAGMAIIMAEPGAEPSSQLVKWVDTWRKPSDHLYFGGAFWKAPNPALYNSPDRASKSK
jgi:hypothetical protein